MRTQIIFSQVLTLAVIGFGSGASAIPTLTGERKVEEVCVRRSQDKIHMLVTVKYKILGNSEMQHSVGLYSAPSYPNGDTPDFLKMIKAPMWYCETVNTPVKFNHTDKYPEAVCRPSFEDFDKLTGELLDQSLMAHRVQPRAQPVERVYTGLAPLDFSSKALGLVNKLKIDEADKARTLKYPNGLCINPSIDYSSAIGDENGEQVCPPLLPGQESSDPCAERSRVPLN